MNSKIYSDNEQNVFLIGDRTFHAQLHRLDQGSESVKLEPRVGQLLSYMLTHPGIALSREQLLEEVWPGTIVGDEALSNTINKLRKAFGDNRQNPQVIETIPKMGYRLIAEVRPLKSSQDTSRLSEKPGNEKTHSKHWSKPASLTLALLGLVSLIIFFAEIDTEPHPLNSESVLTQPVEIANKKVSELPQNQLNAIAVLPFKNLSNDAEQDYFSDGITDDLITDLSNISGLHVIAKSSVFSYKGRSLKVQQLARELAATHVLEGSVRRIGNRIRINAQFTNASTAHHLWAERFDRDLTNIFELQDEITGKIVTALKIKLTDQERSGIQKRYTHSVEAYDLFLKGQQQFLKYTREGNSEARKYYQMAIQSDPEFARALANLGWTYARDFQDGWTTSPEKSLEKALQLALQAKRLDNTSARVHWILGQVYLYKKRYQQAISNVQQAIELNPGNTDAKILLARILIFSGDPTESIRLIRQAIKNNPLYPMQYQMNLGIAYFANNDFEKAEKALEIASNRNPDAQRVRMWLVATLANAGHLEDARWQYEELLMINPVFSIENLSHSIPFRDESIREKLFNGLQLASDHLSGKTQLKNSLKP